MRDRMVVAGQALGGSVCLVTAGFLVGIVEGFAVAGVLLLLLAAVNDWRLRRDGDPDVDPE